MYGRRSRKERKRRRPHHRHRCIHNRVLVPRPASHKGVWMRTCITDHGMHGRRLAGTSCLVSHGPTPKTKCRQRIVNLDFGSATGAARDSLICTKPRLAASAMSGTGWRRTALFEITDSQDEGSRNQATSAFHFYNLSPAHAEPPRPTNQSKRGTATANA